MPLRHALLASALLLSCTLGAPALAAAPHTSSSASAVDGSLRLDRTVEVSPRLRDLTFTTDALAAPTTVRVLLPEDYDPSGATRYPVLFLLHGGAGQHTDWTTGGAAVALTRGLPLIVVMPDAGRSAWYTDWYNNGAFGLPKWETFHIGQLLPWIDENLPTTGARSGRAIAGLSSGGFGALSYASRHPDLFVAAAGFSGALDTNSPPVLGGLVVGSLAVQDRGNPGSLFGLRSTEEVRWRGHNPWDLAENLRHTALTVRAGNGMAGGQFGGGGPADPVGFALEAATHLQSTSFHQRLDALDIPHVWEDYGAGTHSYAYWNEDLRKTLPLLMQVYAERRADPASFRHRAIETSFSVYGWTVDVTRPSVEFAQLDVAGTSRATLSGSGSAVVTTGSVFSPKAPYRVQVQDADGLRELELQADREGRLRLSVDLGPGNPVQQHFAESGSSPATAVRTAEVTFTPR